jgi:uncharacterized protein (DUF885 family)
MQEDGDMGAPPALAKLLDDYFRLHCAADPFKATVNGVSGFDGDVPDPSRAGEEWVRSALASIAADLAHVDVSGLDENDLISHEMLSASLRDEQDTHRFGLHEVAVTASVGGVWPLVVAAVPAANVADPGAAQQYLVRLQKLAGYFDQLRRRHLDAKADGRFPTALGVRQAIAQLDGYLATPVTHDPLIRTVPGSAVDTSQWRSRAGDIVESSVRPALARYRTTLAEELLPVGRGGDRVGVCHVPDGTPGYLAQVRAHTTTSMTPEQIHRIGLDLVAQLREEFAERGAQALATSDYREVIARLRDDLSLRFTAEAHIVDTVTRALRRAEDALPDWFYPYQIAACVVREMDPSEAVNSVLGYYLPPAADGSRPGAHVVNTLHPQLRTRFEYEALAFHESVPGHHLQSAVAQSLTWLPDFRRFAYITAHCEGWALYVERLCDEMGLYSDDLSRLGMVSFDAWRACRLVVDTGMHHLGWSRDQAIAFMRDNTALSDTNITNEIDRYIADPGQALAYMVGRLRIREMRDRARAAVGDGFTIQAFHDQLLSRGPLPLDTLDSVMDRAIAQGKLA